MDFSGTPRSGGAFLLIVRQFLTGFSDQILPDNPDQVKPQFLLQQWREVEEMLVERGL
jgi:hypothetical protein